ncbi:MAG: hypothetical protein RLW87_20375 [Alphaproteobacteria bacterium]
MNVSAVLMTIVTALLAVVIARLFQDGHRLQAVLWIAAMLVMGVAIAWAFILTNWAAWEGRS